MLIWITSSLVWLEKSGTPLKNNPLFPKHGFIFSNFVPFCLYWMLREHILCMFVYSSSVRVCVFLIGLLFRLLTPLLFLKTPSLHSFKAVACFWQTSVFRQPRCCSSAPLKTKLLLAKQTPVCLLARSQNATHVAACLISLPVVHIHCCWAGTDYRVTKMRDRESTHLLAKHLRVS